jgi:dethiobiotin synthetase
VINRDRPVTSRGLLVTGTDTGVGKTLVATALLRAMAGRGLRAVGMKPVAAGCALSAEGLVNEDVVQLVRASTFEAPRDWINPYCFQPPVAPHLAARAAGQVISLQRIIAAYGRLSRLADRVVVEGAGGLLVPLNEKEDFADLARLLHLPVVLVVGMRLGCLNHALLTAQAIAARGLGFCGWVANCLEPDMALFNENLDALRVRIPAPLLGVLPHLPETPEQAAKFLDLDVLDSGFA